MIITENKITGTLKYYEGNNWSEDAGWPEESKKGNFLPLSFESTNATRITCTLSEATHTPGPVDVTEDKFLIARIKATTQTITVTATGNGTEDNTIVYDLSGLTLTSGGDV